MAARRPLTDVADAVTEDMRVGTQSTLGALWAPPGAPPLALIFLRRLG